MVSIATAGVQNKFLSHLLEYLGDSKSYLRGFMVPQGRRDNPPAPLSSFQENCLGRCVVGIIGGQDEALNSDCSSLGT